MKKLCEHCSKEFYDRDILEQKYCGKKCRKKSGRKQNKTNYRARRAVFEMRNLRKLHDDPRNTDAFINKEKLEQFRKETYFGK